MPRPALGLLAALVCTGCSSSSDTDLTTIRLALNWYPEPEFGGFYEGVMGGHYEEVGLNVEIIPGGPGAPTLALLGAGNAQVAITSADDLLIKRLKGIEATAIWAAFQDSPQGLMVHESSPVTQLSDVVHQDSPRVAIEVGRPMHTFLWQQYGWEGKVEAVPYGGSVGVFLNDPLAIQQAYVTSEPCVARSKGAATRFLSVRDAGWNPYGTVVAVSDPEAEWVGAFVQATARAWRAYLRHPAQANSRIGGLNDQIDSTTLSCVTELQRPFVTGDDGLGGMTKERWETTASNLVKIGLLPEGVRAEGAWTVLNTTQAPGSAQDE